MQINININIKKIIRINKQAKYVAGYSYVKINTIIYNITLKLPSNYNHETLLLMKTQ